MREQPRSAFEAEMRTLASLRKGQSLWGDAWRRLRKNRFAMGGLVVVVFMTLISALAPWIVPFEPDYGQPWLLANAPGFEHPAVLAEVRFDKGEAPVVAPGIPDVVANMMESDGVLEYTAHEIEETEYRIKLRRGKVARKGIKRLEGALTVDRLEISGDNAYLQVIDQDGASGVRIRDVVIEPKKALPPALKTTARVIVVKVRRPRTPKPETIRVKITDGRVASIVRDGVEVDKLRIRGRSVIGVTQNGKARKLKHWLGTDLAGRDVLSRVIYGGSISLMVGAIATLVSVLVGVVYGAVAGYLAGHPMGRWAFFATVFGFVVGGSVFMLIPQFVVAVLVAAIAATLCVWGINRLGRLLPTVLHEPVTTTGEFMMRIVDIIYALPFMFVVILLMISFGRDIFTLFLALGLVQWLTMARIVRGQVLSLKEKEFVEAAHMCGASHAGILFRHLIPNTLGVVIVYSTLTIPAVILQESFLAFIGLTVEFQGRTLDSWGSLVNQGRQALTSDGGNWWVLLFPSFAMALTLFSLNFLGDGLRDALDPKLKGRS